MEAFLNCLFFVSCSILENGSLELGEGYYRRMCGAFDLSFLVHFFSLFQPGYRLLIFFSCISSLVVFGFSFSLSSVITSTTFFFVVFFCG